jgi:hypothetical protein
MYSSLRTGSVQASGGHSNPVFYVSDQFPNPTGPATFSLWRWKAGDQGWTRIVPGNGANKAISYFVNPYNRDFVYILDRDGIKRSDHAGVSWVQDLNLQNAMTQNGEFSLTEGFDEERVITDMVFSSSICVKTVGEDWTQKVRTKRLSPPPPLALDISHLSRPTVGS